MGQSLTEYRRYYLHGAFFLLAVAAVLLAVTGGAGRVAETLVSSQTKQQPALAQSETKGYLRPPVVLNTSPGLYVVKQQPEPIAESVPAAGPTPAPTPEPTPPPQPAYVLYTVQLGDTIDRIATTFGIDPKYILLNNPDLSADPDLLLVGQQIQIPSINGLIYNIKLGDTISDLAAFYQVDVQSILAFAPNRLSSPDQVIEGMVLLLPGAVPPPPPIPAAVTAVAATAPPPPPAPSSPAPASSTGYIWPFYGAISTYYGEPRGGGYYHLAIDIDAFGSYGAPVVAAASGQVILVAYQGWGLGNHVTIEHDDGSRTVYAHLSDIYVAQGQYVAQGEAIGAIGCTGYCTGPHLHFELWIAGVPVDPLLYLP